MTLVFGGCRTVNSATGVSSVTVGNTLFVSKTGVDATGARQNFAKHYLTITAAIAAASSGDMIEVFPGTYTESITLATGVRIYCHVGVTIAGKITVGNGTHYFQGRAILTNASGDDNILFTGNASTEAYFEFHSATPGTGWAVNKTGAGYLELSYFRSITCGTGSTGAITTTAGTLHGFGQIVQNTAGYTGTDLIKFDTGTTGNQLAVDQVLRTDQSKRAIYSKDGNNRIYFRIVRGYVQYDAGETILAANASHASIMCAPAAATVAPIVIAGSMLLVDGVSLISTGGTGVVAVYAGSAKNISLKRCEGNLLLHSNVTLIENSTYTYDSTLRTGNP